jgi:hypothetical protein
MYALMTLSKRGDMVLQGNSWVTIYTPITWTCEESWKELLKNNPFDVGLSWVAPFDTTRYQIPERVLNYFNGRGKIV